MPQAKVRHAPLTFPLEIVPLLFLQTCWVALTTEGMRARGRGYNAYSTTFPVYFWPQGKKFHHE